MKKLISVIITAFNEEELLPRCLDSISKQTYENIEVLLVDDGSSDNTLNIMNKYAINNKKVRVFSIKNSGLSAARNVGLKHCSGDVITFLDADDWVNKNMYEVMIKTMYDSKTDICMCKYKKVYKNITVGSADSGEINILDPISASKEILESDNYGQFMCNKIFKKHLFDHDKFKETLLFEDVDIIYRLLLKSKKISVINNNYYYYYQRFNSLSHKISFKFISDQIVVYESLLSNPKCAIFNKQIYNRIFIALIDARVRNIYSKNTKTEKKTISKYTKDKIKQLLERKKLNRKDHFKSYFVLYAPFMFVPKYWFANACLPQYAFIKNLQSKIFVRKVNNDR